MKGNIEKDMANGNNNEMYSFNVAIISNYTFFQIIEHTNVNIEILSLS